MTKIYDIYDIYDSMICDGKCILKNWCNRLFIIKFKNGRWLLDTEVDPEFWVKSPCRSKKTVSNKKTATILEMITAHKIKVLKQKESCLRCFFWQIPWIQVKSSLFSTFRSSDLQPPSSLTFPAQHGPTCQAWANWRQARKAAKLSPPSHRKLLLPPELGAPQWSGGKWQFLTNPPPDNLPGVIFSNG